MEAELLWPRVWQMACRLEEIPHPATSRVRDPRSVRRRAAQRRHGGAAFQNACRHRGVKVVQGRGTCESGFICPFHGWCYGLGRHEHRRPAAKSFASTTCSRTTSTSCRCGARSGVGAPGSTRQRRTAAPAVHRAVRHHPRRLEGGVDAGRVVVRLPSPGQLEARRRSIHGAVPRGGGASPARHPGERFHRLGRAGRPTRASSMRRSTTSAP
jgi:nitrite reductase/ring-hydroxylating ferredoxin subunit